MVVTVEHYSCMNFSEVGIQETVFECVICKMSAVLFKPQGVEYDDKLAMAIVFFVNLFCHTTELLPYASVSLYTVETLYNTVNFCWSTH